MNRCFPVSSAHNLGKQFGTRTGPTIPALIWFQNVWYFGGFLERIFLKRQFWNHQTKNCLNEECLRYFFYYLLTMVGIGDWFSIRVFECVNQYAKFDPNIYVPFGSRVMSIFTNWSRPRPAGLMLSKASSIKKMLRMPEVKQYWHAYVCEAWSKYTMRFKSYEHFTDGQTDGLAQWL